MSGFIANGLDLDPWTEFMLTEAFGTEQTLTAYSKSWEGPLSDTGLGYDTVSSYVYSLYELATQVAAPRDETDDQFPGMLDLAMFFKEVDGASPKHVMSEWEESRLRLHEAQHLVGYFRYQAGADGLLRRKSDQCIEDYESTFRDSKTPSAQLFCRLRNRTVEIEKAYSPSINTPRGPRWLSGKEDKAKKQRLIAEAEMMNTAEAHQRRLEKARAVNEYLESQIGALQTKVNEKGKVAAKWVHSAAQQRKGRHEAALMQQ